MPGRLVLRKAAVWDEAEHPRDRLGRFIEVGAWVRLWGGGQGRVTRNVGGGRVEVDRADGLRVRVHRNYVTVVERPDGTEPTARPADARAAPVRPPTPDAAEVVDDLDPAAVQPAPADAKPVYVEPLVPVQPVTGRWTHGNSKPGPMILDPTAGRLRVYGPGLYMARNPNADFGKVGHVFDVDAQRVVTVPRSRGGDPYEIAYDTLLTVAPRELVERHLPDPDVGGDDFWAGYNAVLDAMGVQGFLVGGDWLVMRDYNAVSEVEQVELAPTPPAARRSWNEPAPRQGPVHDRYEQLRRDGVLPVGAGQIVPIAMRDWAREDGLRLEEVTVAEPSGRLRPVAVRLVDADTGEPVQLGAPAGVRVDPRLIAKGAQRLARWRDKARGYTGPRLPSDGSPMEHADAETMLRGIYDVDLTTSTGRRVQARVTDLSSSEHETVAEGTFTDASTGEVLGRFARVLNQQPGAGGALVLGGEPEPAEIEHGWISVVPAARREGIAAEFNAHAMAHYQELGVRRVTVKAAGDQNQRAANALNGGYVWALHGFDFDDPTGRPLSLTPMGMVLDAAHRDPVTVQRGHYAWPERAGQVIDELARLLDYGVPTPPEWRAENLDWLRALLRTVDPADLPTPYELAMLGVDRPFTDPQTGERTWFGKAAMSRSTWTGYFDVGWLAAGDPARLEPAEAKALTATGARAGLLGACMLASLGSDGPMFDALSAAAAAGDRPTGAR